MTLREPRHLVWDERLPETDMETVESLKKCLDRLNALRAVEINIAGHFARSKIAWMLATWQHALLHRVVALMDGIAVAWNNRCTLSAMLSARAFMETVAVVLQSTLSPASATGSGGYGARTINANVPMWRRAHMSPGSARTSRMHSFGVPLSGLPQ